MTNADHIREMSNIQLAQWLSLIMHCQCCPQYEAEICMPDDDNGDDGFCSWDLLMWLEAERKETDDDG